MIKKAFFNLFRIVYLFLYKITQPFIKEEFVIIAGFKARYLTGNNQYLFHYLETVDTNFNYFFYTKEKKVYRELIKIYPDKILYTYSLKTAISLLRSKVLIITSGVDDFSPYPILKKKKVINIWHGIPIKKIGYPKDKKEARKFDKFAKAINFFSVSGNFDGDIIQKAFKLNKNQIFKSGLCKNDFINQNMNLKGIPFENNKVIIYAPTFRDDGIKKYSFNELFPIQELNALLKRHNTIFLYRSHFNTEEQKATEGYNRIISASAKDFLDPQPLLYYSDIMITDYSGIYFDYLLMNRPIIFYNYDYEEYERKRGFLYNYEENTPGPKVKTKDNLLIAIENYLVNPNLDTEFREIVKNKFHLRADGKACERTYKLIEELL